MMHVSLLSIIGTQDRHVQKMGAVPTVLFIKRATESATKVERDPTGSLLFTGMGLWVRFIIERKASTVNCLSWTDSQRRKGEPVSPSFHWPPRPMPALFVSQSDPLSFVAN